MMLGTMSIPILSTTILSDILVKTGILERDKKWDCSVVRFLGGIIHSQCRKLVATARREALGSRQGGEGKRSIPLNQWWCYQDAIYSFAGIHRFSRHACKPPCAFHSIQFKQCMTQQTRNKLYIPYIT